MLTFHKLERVISPDLKLTVLFKLNLLFELYILSPPLTKEQCFNFKSRISCPNSQDSSQSNKLLWMES